LSSLAPLLRLALLLVVVRLPLSLPLVVVALPAFHACLFLAHLVPSSPTSSSFELRRLPSINLHPCVSRFVSSLF
jgi:hypothetical protein